MNGYYINAVALKLKHVRGKFYSSIQAVTQGRIEHYTAPDNYLSQRKIRHCI